MLQLRPYQTACLDAIEKELAAGVSRQLVVKATGLGKTITFCELIKRRGGRALILAHRDELLKQAVDKLLMVAPEYAGKVGVVRAEQDDCKAEVVIGSVQTLSNQVRMDRVGYSFNTVVVDEVHHAAAASYRRVLDRLETPLLLGVTATPERTDRKSLFDIFQKIVFRYSLLQGVGAGYLCDLRSKQVALSGLDLESVKTRGEDWDTGELGLALEEAEAPRKTAAAVLEWAQGRKSLIFTPTVATAAATKEALEQAGLRATWISGETQVDERRKRIGDFAEGKYHCMVNCAVLLEGYDEPSVDCVVIARPTRSRIMYQQMIGRGTRLNFGKKDCIAEGQRVLTDHGLIPIEQVTLKMKVWDGVDFVSHCGTVLRGEREVIEYAGLVATPDHKVWTSEGWLSFRTCASQQTSIAVTEVGGEGLQQIAGHFRNSLQRSNPVQTGEVAGGVHRLQDKGATKLRLPDKRHGRMQEVRASTFGSEVASHAMPRGTAEMYEPERSSLRAVRWPGDQVQVLWSYGDGYLDREEPRPQAVAISRQDRERRTLRTREFTLGNTFAQSEQHTEASSECSDAHIQDEASGDSVRRFNPPRDAWTENESERDNPPLPSVQQQAKRRVWDILNAGPRHRFTVEGLLVSNCLVLDLVGASETAGLVTFEELFSLSQKSAEAGLLTTLREVHGQAEAGKQDAQIEVVERGRLHWVEDQRPEGSRWLLSCGEETLVLGRLDGKWGIRSLPRDRGQAGKLLYRDLTLDYAQGVAEDYVRAAGAWGLVDSGASWRRGPASEKQVELLRKVGVQFKQAGPDGRGGISKGEASDLLSKRFLKHR